MMNEDDIWEVLDKLRDLHADLVQISQYVALARTPKAFANVVRNMETFNSDTFDVLCTMMEVRDGK